MQTSRKPGARRARRFLSSAAWLPFAVLALDLPSPVYAQDTAELYRNSDANGVDLVTGYFNFSMSEGSIGTGPGLLEMRRILLRGARWTDNWSGVLHKKTVSGLTTVRIEFGEVSDMFWLNSGVYVSVKGDGSKLVALAGGLFRYTGRDGTVIDYNTRDDNGNPVDVSDCNSSLVECGAPVSITTPNNAKYTLEWLFISVCDEDESEEECPNGRGFGRLSSIAGPSDRQILIQYATDDPGTNVPPNNWFRRTGVTFSDMAESCGSACPSTTYAISYPAGGGSALTVTDALSRQWRFTTSGGAVTAIKRPGSSVDTTTIAYGTGGVVTSITRDGAATTYSRSVSGTTATTVVTNALSQSTTIVADTNLGRVTSVTDALGKTSSRQYDMFGRLTRETKPEGNYVQYVYDARGNVTESRLKSKTAGTPVDIVTTASYPTTCSNTVTCNRPLWTKDANGNQTDYTYDAGTGAILTLTAPAPTSGSVRPQTRYSYTTVNGVSLLTGVSACASGSSCSGTAAESKVTIGYDTQHRPITVMQAAGDNSLTATTAYGYDFVGNIISVDGPLSGSGDVTTMRYDAARQRVGIISPDPDGAGALKRRATKTTYNDDGNPTLIEAGTVNGTSDIDWAGFSARETTAIAYDAHGRAVKSEVSSDATTYAVAQASYDILGRVDCTAQRMNIAVFGSLPASACTAGTAGGAGPDRIVKTGYDAVGRVTKVQTAFGIVGVQADEVTTAYTSNGQVDYVIDAENNRTDYGYDGHDRLVKTEYPSTTKGSDTANPADFEQLAYDANGNVTGRRLRDGTSIGYGYDNLNRLVSKDLPGSEPDATYSYDLLGRPATAVQDGQTLSFVHDALGRKIGESIPYLGATGYAYDAAGRRTSMSYPGGVLTVNYDHDVTGNVTAIRENGASSGAGVLATYAFDDLGRRTSVTFGNGSTQNFAYDPASRLETLTNDLNGAATTHDLTQTFAYNPASQITSVMRSNDAYAWQGHYNVDRAYVADGLNRITSAGTTSIGYDARGNLSMSGGDSYGYDSENRMTGAPGGTTLHYDPAARLKRIYSAAAGTTWFGYDGVDRTLELDVVGTVLRRYVHGPGIDNPIVWYEGAGLGDRRFLMADERGSVVSVSDSAGATTGLNSYDEYGNPAPGNVGRFGYTGQTWLPELGMWYYKARIYSPTLGRFMQTDPIGYADGMNWYNYVGSDPVNYADPSGLCTQMVGGEGPDGGKPYPPENCPKRGFLSPLLEMQFRMLDFYNLSEKTFDGSKKSEPRRIECAGPVQLLEGNPDNIGKEGFPNHPRIRNGSAAVVPRQFTGAERQGPLLRAIGASTYGGVGYHKPDGSIGKESFQFIDQSVGNTGITREEIVNRANGNVVIEIIGGSGTDYNAYGIVNMPDYGQGCPQGMGPAK